MNRKLFGAEGSIVAVHFHNQSEKRRASQSGGASRKHLRLPSLDVEFYQRRKSISQDRIESRYRHINRRASPCVILDDMVHGVLISRESQRRLFPSKPDVVRRDLIDNIVNTDICI